MPRQTPRSSTPRFLAVASVASSSLLDFLVPAIAKETTQIKARHDPGSQHLSRRPGPSSQDEVFETFFFDALSRVGTCPHHRVNARPEFQRNPVSISGLRSSRRATHTVPRALKPRQDVRGLSTVSCRNNQADSGERARMKTKSWSAEGASPGLFDSKAKMMASHSHLPKDFFDDVFEIQLKMRDWVPEPTVHIDVNTAQEDSHAHTEGPSESAVTQDSTDLSTQIKLLKSVRDLEEKLAKAKRDLDASLQRNQSRHASNEANTANSKKPSILLNKNDYLGLVDLYFYSHRDRFHPEGQDYSPSPLFLEDYSFKLSENYEVPASVRDDDLEDELYESPLKEVEKTLLNNQLREVSVMQKFVDLLLDDNSSNLALYNAYRMFPHPGVASLPKGVIRLFLQRMSTPWIKSQNSMLRYLSLIDDMQAANLPITQAEWSSAIYLAGRSMSKVTSADVGTAMSMWRRMEHETGVKATHVTFNILFDIAVRAGKYTLADHIMKEMWARDLRLNRLGRVSLIYYHGLRLDGDAVRQTYRDFVEAGEIVDTLVLNCVIASLLNAQEPSAAEQLYSRMKDLQKRFESGQRADGSETFFIRYPDTESSVIDREPASNALGRILLYSARLKDILPDHHTDLQTIMPLRPDYVTFRALIAYHANVTGDLDRITVLLKDMTEEFGLSMRNVFYQLIFKGFALHGRMNDADERWTFRRLELVWDSCRQTIIDTRAAKRAAKTRPEQEAEPLPKVAEVDEKRKAEVAEQANDKANVARQTRLDPWSDFVLDLAAFPRKRRKPIERIHAMLFDDEPAATGGFLDPFFPKRGMTEPPVPKDTFYALGHETIDHEEGEYVLPSPSRTAMAISPGSGATHELFPTSNDPHPGDVGQTTAAQSEPTQNIDGISPAPSEPSEGSPHGPSEAATDAGEDRPYSMDEVVGSRPMFCWLLRGYARTTGSRDKVEEIYNSIRKLWKPETREERDAVVRVLNRCLRDCDRYGGHML